VKVVASNTHLLHDPKVEFETSVVHSPFEHPGRAKAIEAALRADPAFEFVGSDEWGVDPIVAIHDPGLAGFLAVAWAEYQKVNGDTSDVVPDVFANGRLRHGMGERGEPTSINGRLGYWCFETTTPLTETTYEAARGAVDVAVSAAQRVLDGEPSAYGLCRPPGHHATSSLYGGYCFFNNAAIAAQHVVAATGGKVTVLDVDYHHGNGTQEIFYGRDDVQYVSLHGDPARAYPYHTGFADETGAGRGRGATLNLPMPQRADDDVYCSGLATACERIAAFGPSVVIVSLGVDTFHNDPISDLAVSTEGFRRQAALVAELGLPVVVLQEGGYDVEAIGANVRSFLTGLAR
jgi:acetoin utilization deacetylase AcuC-like enzyme